jgi:heat shock protein HslJ
MAVTPGNLFYNPKNSSMKKLLVLILISACLLALMVCRQPVARQTASSAEPSVARVVTGPPDTTTLGGTWFLLPVLPSDTATGMTPTLRLDLSKTHFTGSTGCNRMSGVFWYSGKDSSLAFNDKFITTKRACPGYDEKAFIKSLLHTDHYRLQNGRLTLLSDGNTELSRWTRKERAPAKTAKA